jgi:hypothetical protein
MMAVAAGGEFWRFCSLRPDGALERTLRLGGGISVPYLLIGIALGSAAPL